MHSETLIPDHTVIVDGALIKQLTEKTLKCADILIHESLVAYLESQARIGTAQGNIGVDELEKLSALTKEKGIILRYAGRRLPRHDSEDLLLVDQALRDLALETGGTFVTSRHLQQKIANAQGITVHFIERLAQGKKMQIEQFFETTMSVHLREKVQPMRKRGKPGAWTFDTIREELLTAEEIKTYSREIIEESTARDDGFLEIERPGSTIAQIGNYRIVITRPPFSDGWEITAVRPVKKLTLDEYNLSEKLANRIKTSAEGILIAGAPGQGKTTFTQALAEEYAAQGKIVKTVEAPRDMVLPETITQHEISHGSSEEVHDILLLSRPDYTIFYEIRNTKDFELFADLRLSGVGMVGVLHATKAVDAIQRFLGRIELGVIPQVIDTVLFIKNGTVYQTLSIQMSVKVPAGMTEEDIARPVVEVLDFESGKAIAEIYSYGEETVVVPVKDEGKKEKRGARALAAKQIERSLQRFTEDVQVEVISDGKAIIRVPEKDIGMIIGKEGKRIQQIEEELGISLDVQELGSGGVQREKGTLLSYTTEETKKSIEFHVEPRYSGKNIYIYLKGVQLATVAASREGIISIRKDNALGKTLTNALHNEEELTVRVE